MSEPTSGRVLLPRDCWLDVCEHVDTAQCEANAQDSLEWITQQGFTVVSVTTPARTPSPEPG